MIVDAVSIDPDKIRKAPGGGIIVEGRIGRSGIQEYRRPDGTLARVYRPEAEVLAADFKGSPLTVGHPPGGVTPRNFKDVSVGHTNDRSTVQRFDGQVYPVHGLQVNDQATIERILSGELTELSCCYDADQDPTPGVADGQPYDLVFRNLVPNHIAFGGDDFARAGRKANLLVADGATEETVLMSVSKLDRRVSDSADPPAPDRDSLVAEIAVLKAETARLAKVADDAKSALDAAEGARAAAEALAAQAPQQIADGISAGLAFRETARKVLGPEYVFDGKADELVKGDIRAAKIAKLVEVDASLQVADSASEEWIDGALAFAAKAARPHDYNTSQVADGSTSAATDMTAFLAKRSADLFKGTK